MFLNNAFFPQSTHNRTASTEVHASNIQQGTSEKEAGHWQVGVLFYMEKLGAFFSFLWESLRRYITSGTHENLAFPVEHAIPDFTQGVNSVIIFYRFYLLFFKCVLTLLVQSVRSFCAWSVCVGFIPRS